MAVSTDGGQTFTDYPVYINPDPTVGYGHQFVNVSVDSAGNVYSVYTDDHHVYYSFSTDHGKTWTGPYRITTTSGTQIFPWSTAGDAGKLDVVYYQTPYYNGDERCRTTTRTRRLDGRLRAEPQRARSRVGWSRQTASPIIHHGGVCEAGVTCSGNRDLYDDFGVAASPTTGLASIVYSDDQFDPSGPNTSRLHASDEQHRELRPHGDRDPDRGRESSRQEEVGNGQTNVGRGGQLFSRPTTVSVDPRAA